MIFLISDLHFCHARILEYCDRPFRDLNEMHSELISRWNKVVGPSDTVFVVGDFGFLGVQKGKEILSKLNGIHVLVLGNHDNNEGRSLRMGFSSVCKEHTLQYRGLTFRLSHFPYKTKWFFVRTYYKLFKFWLKSLSSKNRAKFLRKIQDYKRGVLAHTPRRKNEDWLIQGHVHNAWPFINFRRKMINVSADVLDFTPISIEEIYVRISDPKEGGKAT